MNKVMLICLMAVAQPAAAAPLPAGQVAESKLEHSNVSLVVEPRLDDGRLVLKLAAQNLTTAPVAFGPSAVLIRRSDGTTIALLPLQRLIDAVRSAAGVSPDRSRPSAASAYVTPQVGVDGSGRPDVSAYTGSSAVAGDEIIRQSKQGRARPSLSAQQAEQQIQALRQAILQDVTLAPGKVAAGQLVSEKVSFAKKADRSVQVSVTLAGDEHRFTVVAPAD